MNNSHLTGQKTGLITGIWKSINNAAGVFFRFLTKIVLFVCFYTVFAATALILKLFGKKTLPVFSKDNNSCWTDKEPVRLSKEEMKKQG